MYPHPTPKERTNATQRFHCILCTCVARPAPQRAVNRTVVPPRTFLHILGKYGTAEWPLLPSTLIGLTTLPLSRERRESHLAISRTNARRSSVCSGVLGVSDNWQDSIQELYPL